MIVSSKREKQSPEDIKTKRVIWVLAGVIILLIVGFGALYLRDKNILLNKQKIVTQEVDKLLADVSNLVALPIDEEPTIFTVMNVDILKQRDPEFYKNVAVGDKIIIYTTRAIIYRPISGEVINVTAVE